jgi:hypothetical protein
MTDDDAAPIIFFIASVYAFGIVLLYVLARAWEAGALDATPPGRSREIRENSDAAAKECHGYRFIADDEHEGAS